MAGPEQAEATRFTGAVFATTQWSVVLAAGTGTSPDSQQALEQLCRRYWPPIYAFLRRDGHPRADAEDLTQGFFASLIARRSFAALGPERGRFRSFLLACLRHYLADVRDYARALKRGGGRPLISLEGDEAEALCARQVADENTPERAFDRQWAETLLRRAQERLRAECAAAGKLALYEDLGPQRLGDRDLSGAELAARHGMSENAVRLAAFRLRRRYQELVRDEVRQTVATPEELEEELRHLLRALTP
jgi:RNA polymerase sigma-70 factor (ECF subfamily)